MSRYCESISCFCAEPDVGRLDSGKTIMAVKTEAVAGDVWVQFDRGISADRKAAKAEGVEGGDHREIQKRYGWVSEHQLQLLPKV